jgi:hypothetical protein
MKINCKSFFLEVMPLIYFHEYYRFQLAFYGDEGVLNV